MRVIGGLIIFGIGLLLLMTLLKKVKEGWADFWPSEARIVPSHASYSNKFNDVIGNENSGIIGEGCAEVVVPSDWYMSRYLPTEFDGGYWPNGGIQPDFLYPGSDPKRPLRPQTLYASQSVFPSLDSSAIYTPKKPSS
jgi:hypothetical protein